MEKTGMTNVVPVVLNGPGRVGKEFVRLLSLEGPNIRRETGYIPVLRAVSSRRGILFSHMGLSSDDVLGWLDADAGLAGSAGAWSWMQGGPGASRLSVFPVTDYSLILDLARGDVPGVVVEATPTNLETGEPGLSHIVSALEKGFGVISLAKGPLVVAFGDLTELAGAKGVSLRYSGAVAAALPTVDTATYSMALSHITEIEGVLNGTTNLILNEMGQGRSYSEALARAQALGVAEANPRLDVEGYDSAAKMLIIANTVWGCNLTLEAVDREGIAGMDASSVRECFEKGTPVRLLARAVFHESSDDAGTVRSLEQGENDTENGQAPRLSVRPEPVAADHPFWHLPGTSKAVRFKSRHMGEVVVSGGASDVTGAAASAVKDLVHELKERRGV